MTSIINANNSGITITSDLSASVSLQTANTTAINIDSTQNSNIATTGAIIVPVGTTAQRPTATNGMIRYNTSNNAFEVYTNSSWKTQTLTYLPVNSVAPVISGTPTVGQTLSSTTGTWSNSPTSYGYQWLANATAISNATSNTFVLTSTQNGANITCNVTATNKAGTANAVTSNSIGPVVNQYTVTYLVVAGGGGGGGGWNSGGGGGGGGGFLNTTTSFTPGVVYTATVGGGGPAFTTGTNSSITGTGLSIVATGGGGGRDGTGNGNATGQNGGSGGGGSCSSNVGWGGGTGTAGQGNNGGNANTAGTDYWSGGGGGGAGAAGGNGGGNTPGNGGSGAASSITGASVYYAGGGGGSGATGISGAGGNGGGGAGNSSGTANTGGGGGGKYSAYSGGSGIVIISVPTSRYTGTYTGSPTITTNGSDTVLKYTSSGTYTA